METIEEIRVASEMKELPPKEERDQIISELQALTKETSEIDLKFKAGAFLSWFEPTGDQGRSWDEEMDYALAHRHEGYVPKMRYPAIERGYLDPDNRESSGFDFDGGMNKLEEMTQDLETRFKKTRDIAKEMIERKRLEFLFISAVKNGDHESVIKYMPYKTPDDELVSFARACHESDLNPKSPKTKFEERLDKNILSANEAKEYFEYALSQIDARGWKVKLSDKRKAVSVSSDAKEVSLWQGEQIKASTMIKLIAHEIGIHAGTAVNAERNGFGGAAIGEESEILQEGLATVAENDIEMLLYGSRSDPAPNYVLAINESSENGGDFWKTYEFIKKTKIESLTARGKTPEEAEKISEKTAKRILRRIYRGSVDLGKGGYTFTKDKAYLEGELSAQKIKDAGLLGYMLSGRFDIPTAIYLLKNGVIPKDAVHLVADVAQRIWSNEGDRDFFVNLQYYRENYNQPYWREQGLSDEEYLRRWQEMK